MTPNPGEMIVVCRFGEEGTAVWNDTSWGMAYTVVDSGEAQHGLSVRFLDFLHSLLSSQYAARHC